MFWSMKYEIEAMLKNPASSAGEGRGAIANRLHRALTTERGRGGQTRSSLRFVVRARLQLSHTPRMIKVWPA